MFHLKVKVLKHCNSSIQSCLFYVLHEHCYKVCLLASRASFFSVIYL